MTPPRLMLYGATGYSGRLIVDELRHDAAAAHAQGRPPLDWVLAGRDAAALKALADRQHLPWRAFDLDDADTLPGHLAGVQVLLNAAGPYGATAEPLVRAAILAGCHYVDLNGEVDVWLRIDDQARDASLRGLTLVSGAGQTATVSDWLLTQALTRLRQAGIHDRLGAVRIAVTPLADFSRGSVRTMLNAVREQVTVVEGDLRDDAPPRRRLRLAHVPVGRLERNIDFALPGDPPAPGGSGVTATAANLVDTLAAKRSCEELGFRPRRIESYIAMPASWRLAYQWGALAAPWTVPLAATLPGRWWSERVAATLPPGPTPKQRQARRHRVVVQVDDETGCPCIDYRIDTPDPYDFSARSAVAVARRLATDAQIERGWQTSGALLIPASPAPLPDGPVTQAFAFRDCRFHAARDLAPALHA